MNIWDKAEKNQITKDNEGVNRLIMDERTRTAEGRSSPRIGSPLNIITSSHGGGGSGEQGKNNNNGDRLGTKLPISILASV